MEKRNLYILVNQKRIGDGIINGDVLFRDTKGDKEYTLQYKINPSPDGVALIQKLLEEELDIDGNNIRKGTSPELVKRMKRTSVKKDKGGKLERTLDDIANDVAKEVKFVDKYPDIIFNGIDVSIKSKEDYVGLDEKLKYEFIKLIDGVLRPISSDIRNESYYLSKMSQDLRNLFKRYGTNAR